MSETISQNTNPLLCDIESGICEISDFLKDAKKEIIPNPIKPMKIIYFTDPICSSCWGIEPQLRKLKLEYGHLIEIEYRMGGLLPDWNYNSGGISKPSDVADHWDEVSQYYDMPIDGDLWLEDPLHSSYPPSIAFKAADIQDKTKAILFLRELRELVFLKKKNITKWEYLEEAALKVHLDLIQLKEDYIGIANQLFIEDLQYARRLGVRGFPTLFFCDQTGIREKIYGFKPYNIMENAILKTLPKAEKNNYEKHLDNLLKIYSTMTSREYAELSEINRNEVELLLNKYHTEGYLQKLETKNGILWIKI